MQIIFENVEGNDTVYMDTLMAICGDTKDKSMLDAMCNLAPHTPLLGYGERAYVDVLPRILDHKEEQKYFIQEDVFTYLKSAKKKYDTIICSDGIEHITVLDGYALLCNFGLMSNKDIIFTPLGEHMVEDGNNPESHHSGWYPEMLPRGYASIVFPQYHPTLGIGAFFSWSCRDIDADFERVKDELEAKKWWNRLEIKGYPYGFVVNQYTK